jgi:hypothetical protein
MTYPICFDKFEIASSAIPYSLWATQKEYARIITKKDPVITYFVKACIDIAGTVTWNIFYGRISCTERAAFLNDVMRIYDNL